LGHLFLSRTWFSEVSRLHEDAGEIEMPVEVRALRIDLEILEGPDGETVHSHFGNGTLAPGHVDAPTKVKLPYDIARKIFVERDPTAAMRAFMTGQIKVEGDITKLLSMQAIRQTPSPAAVTLIARIAEITE